MRKNRLTLLIIAAFLSGVYFFVLGDSGIIERFRLMDEKQIVKARIQRREILNENLKLLHNKYRKGEYTREDVLKAGYIAPGERVVFIKNFPNDEKNTEPFVRSGRVYVELRHLRILFAIVSLTILILLLIREKNRMPE